MGQLTEVSCIFSYINQNHSIQSVESLQNLKMDDSSTCKAKWVQDSTRRLWSVSFPCPSHVGFSWATHLDWVFPKHFISSAQIKLPLHSYYITAFTILLKYMITAVSPAVLLLSEHVTPDWWEQKCTDTREPWTPRAAVVLCLGCTEEQADPLRWWVG